MKKNFIIIFSSLTVISSMAMAAPSIESLSLISALTTSQKDLDNLNLLFLPSAPAMSINANLSLFEKQGQKISCAALCAEFGWKAWPLCDCFSDPSTVQTIF